MNVFDAILSSDMDSIEREFIMAETALDIDLERAQKEYIYESGLIAYSEENTFFEAGDDVKNEGAFTRFVNSIINGIRNFFTSIGNTISNIFNKNKNLTESDFLKSSSAKIKLEKDVEKMDKVVDDEVRKGNDLLQKVSSATGVSDDTIQNWIDKGTERIKQVGPTTIAMGTAAVVRGIFNGIFKKNDDNLKATKKFAFMKSSKKDKNAAATEERQKKTILSTIAGWTRELGKTITLAGTGLNTAYKEESKRLKQSAKEDKSEVRKKYDDLINKPIDDDEAYIGATHVLSSAEREASKAHAKKQKALADEREQNVQAVKLKRQSISEIENRYRRGSITKGDKKSYINYINTQYNAYMSKKINFNDYTRKLSMSNILK